MSSNALAIMAYIGYITFISIDSMGNVTESDIVVFQHSMAIMERQLLYIT